MASTSDRPRSRSVKRNRLKPIPLVVARCHCPCARNAQMVVAEAELPPDFPWVPCRCNSCGPTAYVGCSTRIAPFLEVCDECRPFWTSQAHLGSSDLRSRVIAQVNIIMDHGDASRSQARHVLHIFWCYKWHTAILVCTCACMTYTSVKFGVTSNQWLELADEMRHMHAVC